MRRFTSARHVLAVSFMLGIGGLGMPLSAWAQTTEPVFEIAPQSLSTALTAFSRQSGWQVSADAASVQGLETQGVSGAMSAEEALQRLLQGTDVIYSATGNQTVVLSNAAGNGAGFEGGILLDQIVVEGELLNRTVQESQTSVAVITGEALEQRNDVNLSEAAERTANVSVSNGRAGFVIRGIDERGAVQNSFATPTITTSVDGARFSDFGRRELNFLSTWDLEQVEFLRGPQSTQTGRNALAGAVVVRTKDPSYEQEFKARVAAGNGSTFQAAFAANQPIIEDKLAIRIAGDLKTEDGFVTNQTLGIDDAAGFDNREFRGAIRFDPTDRFSAILKLSYTDRDAGQPESDTALFPDRIVSEDAPRIREAQFLTTNLRMGYDLSETIRLESETTFLDRQIDQTNDLDQTAGPFAVISATGEGRSISQEVKLFYEDDHINAVVGGFFTSIQDDDLQSTEAVATFFDPIFPPSLIATSLTDLEVETQNFAVFGEVEVNVLEDFRLIAGGRYDRETQDRQTVSTVELNNPLFNPFLPPPTEESTSTTFDAFLPKAGIVYDVLEDVSIGFTYQRGYRAGGISINSFNQTRSEFDPEYTNNYELSFRSQWFDDRLTANANAFYIGWKDQQVIVQGPSGNPLDTTVENAGASRLFGGEAELSARPYEGLEMFASLGYVDTEFEDFISRGVQLAGNEFRNAPKWTGSVGASYSFENGIFLASDASYTAGAFGDPFNADEFRSDPRLVLNLRVGYEAENFSVIGYIDNLTDVDYIEGRGATLSTVGDPLTFGLIGQVNF
ncbi:MAG: TonB-dependent receptor [Pseudomonadota bacterium]